MPASDDALRLEAEEAASRFYSPMLAHHEAFVVGYIAGHQKGRESTAERAHQEGWHDGRYGDASEVRRYAWDESNTRREVWPEARAEGESGGTNDGE